MNDHWCQMMSECPAAGIVPGSVDNPLLNAATPLLNAIVQIRMAATHDDPAGLRQQLVDEIRHFEARCKQAGLSFDMLIGCRYCLCSTLDEAASRTPWGSRGVWSGNGLLVTFHNESWGGEKFFQLLARISQSAAQHLWLLEVIHYCLLLGYEGRYRAQQNGRAQCDAVCHRLAKLIETTRDNTPGQPLVDLNEYPAQATLWHPPVPLWTCVILTTLLACLFYTALNWRLGNAAESVLREIYQISLPAVNYHAETNSLLLNLRQALHAELHRGQLQVTDAAAGSKIILPSDPLFTADSTQLTPEGRTLLLHLSQVLAPISGTVLVSAYSDDRPALSGRFTSSYEYTLAQALAVSSLLTQQLAGTSLRNVKAEGRGDSDDLLPNDSHENRQRNRRIEVAIFATPASDSQTTNEASYAP